MTKYLITLFSLSLLTLSVVYSQPSGWGVDPSQFEYSTSYTWQVTFASSDAVEAGDYLAAFIGDEVRGVVAALYHPGYDAYFFPLLVYSDQASGESISFQFYDASEAEMKTLEGEYTFELDQVVGSFSDPVSHTVDDLLPQSILFGPLSDQTYGAEAFEVIASGGAGTNPVMITSSNTNVATVNGTTVTIVGAGVATLTATQSGDDVFGAAEPVSQQLIVHKAVLTMKTENHTINVGERLPELTYSISGFVNNDTEEDLDESPTLVTNVTSSEVAGAYAITLTGGSDDNYHFSLTHGVLTITTATVLGLQDEEAYEVYPNPCVDYLKVASPNLDAFSLYSLNGQLVNQGKLVNDRIDMIRLPTGAYLVSLKDKDGKNLSISRVVKQ